MHSVRHCDSWNCRYGVSSKICAGTVGTPYRTVPAAQSTSYTDIQHERRVTSSPSRDVVDVDVLGGARAEHWLALVVVPERGDDVSDDEVGGVLGDQFEHKHAVLPQVHLSELVRYLAVLVVRRIHLPHYLHAADTSSAAWTRLQT